MTYSQYPQNYNYAQQTQVLSLIKVQSAQDAERYPVTAGNTVYFIDDNAPYIYSKTQTSAFGQPDFKIFEVRELEAAKITAQNGSQSTEGKPTVDLSDYTPKADTEALRAELEQLRAAVEKLTAKPTKKANEREVKTDE